jgi:hypothetical protein
MTKRRMYLRTMRCKGGMPRGRDLGRAASIHGERVSRFERGMPITLENAVHTTHGERQEPWQCR